MKSGLRLVNQNRPGSPGSIFRVGLAVNFDGFKQLGSGLTEAQLERILFLAMASMANEASDTCPVDTGLLRSTVRLRRIYESAPGTVYVALIYGSGEAYYAPYIEFGYTRGDGTQVPGRYVLRNAYERKKDEVRAQVFAELQKTLPKRARRMVV